MRELPIGLRAIREEWAAQAQRAGLRGDVAAWWRWWAREHGATAGREVWEWTCQGEFCLWLALDGQRGYWGQFVDLALKGRYDA